MGGEDDCHKRAFHAVRSGRVPGLRGVVVRKVAVAFSRLGIDPRECKIDCSSPAVQKLMERPGLREPLEAMCRHGLADKWWYRGVCQREVAGRYGFGRANLVRFVDMIVLMENGGVWVVEVKPSLDYEALGQVLTYKLLLWEDHPELGEPKAAIIVCGGGDPMIEAASLRVP